MKTKQHSIVDLKIRVILEIFHEDLSLMEISQKYYIPVRLLKKWKQEFMLELNKNQDQAAFP
ncbi:MAG: hypothetical protein ACNS62_00500 [Candidatus Cyclobacteriaceae bacterium M3_2C_046]